jgi:pimeloyl-ACP methyl ester carboxylesterase
LEEAVDAVANYNPNRPRSADPSGLQRNLRRRDDGRLYWHWDPRLVPPNIDDDLLAMADIMHRLSAIEGVPILLVRGSSSDVVSVESAAEFHRALPGAEILEVPAAGHMVVGDRNDEFNAGVHAFLSRHFPVSRRSS